MNEDSNTPPAMQVETWVGDYDINYMVFPAFPRPGEPGRINLYVKNHDTGQSFTGKVAFTVRNDSWKAWLGLGNTSEPLGVQLLDDFVFRQGFLFKEPGDYLINAQFEADGEPYIIDFPLRVGAPSPWGPVGITVGILLGILVVVSILKRRQLMTGKIRDNLEDDE